MKKLLSLALAVLLPLSLAACGDGPAPSFAGSSGGGPSSTGSAQTEEFTPVTTEAEVRALYEGDEDGTILSVEEYQGDFLVTLDIGGATILDWVYDQSGIRRQLLWLSEPILSREINGQADVRVVTGGPSVYDSFFGFPHVEWAGLSPVYDQQGRELSDSPSDRAIHGSSTYWAGAGEGYPMGRLGRRAAIRAAQIDAEGLTVAFAPLADGSDFLSSTCAIPYAEVGLSQDSRTLTVTLHDTFLDCGTLSKDADLDFLREYGSLYPESFPAGELAGSCVLIEKAELRQDGNDAVLTVTLDESHLHGSYQGDAAFRFTAETGYTGPGDVGPFLRVTVHAVTEPLD